MNEPQHEPERTLVERTLVELYKAPVAGPQGNTQRQGSTPTMGECKLLIEQLNGNEGHLYAAGNSHYIAYLMAWLFSEVERYRNATDEQAKTLYTESRDSSVCYNREWELQRAWRDAAGNLERLKAQLEVADARTEQVEALNATLQERVNRLEALIQDNS